MKNNKRILAFIPARIGSKRIPRKNIVKINGKFLFQYSVDVAKQSKYIDDVLVSSDSWEILNLAHAQGCLKNELRPKELANDTARIIDGMLYELEKQQTKYDVVVLLQPTFPIRSVEMVDKAIDKYFEKETSLVSVCECEDHPIFMRTIANDKLYKILDSSTDIRSQDLFKVYKICGNIYINNIHKLNSNTILNENDTPYILDKKFCIDIDTEKDLEMAKEVLEKR